MGTKTPISLNELAIYKSKYVFSSPLISMVNLKKTFFFKLKHESELTKPDSARFTRISMGTKTLFSLNGLAIYKSK